MQNLRKIKLTLKYTFYCFEYHLENHSAVSGIQLQRLNQHSATHSGACFNIHDFIQRTVWNSFRIDWKAFVVRLENALITFSRCYCLFCFGKDCSSLKLWTLWVGGPAFTVTMTLDCSLYFVMRFCHLVEWMTTMSMRGKPRQGNPIWIPHYLSVSMARYDLKTWSSPWRKQWFSKHPISRYL